MTLTEFLLARIAEDEAWVIQDRECRCSPVEHPAPDCPARVLAECEAKRRIVEIATASVAGISEGRPHRSFLSGRVHDGAKTLALLAQPYADHPDCSEEWRGA